VSPLLVAALFCGYKLAHPRKLCAKLLGIADLQNTGSNFLAALFAAKNMRRAVFIDMAGP
jgi:hypothetical protein